MTEEIRVKRQISQSELEDMIAAHHKWLDRERGGVRFIAHDLYFPGLSIKKADLRKAYVIESDFAECEIKDSNLDKLQFTGSNLTKVTFSGVNAVSADFRGCDLTKSVIEGSDLTGATLGHSNISRAYIEGSILKDTALNNTNLGHTEFLNTDLSNSHFAASNLNFTSFDSCDLQFAGFRCAKFKGVNMRNVKLFKGLNLREEQEEELFIDEIEVILGVQRKWLPKHFESRHPCDSPFFPELMSDQFAKKMKVISERAGKHAKIFKTEVAL